MDITEKTIYICNKCQFWYEDKKTAESCCQQRCCTCGKPIKRSFLKCENCAEKERFEKTEKITPSACTGWRCKEGLE